MEHPSASPANNPSNLVKTPLTNEKEMELRTVVDNLMQGRNSRHIAFSPGPFSMLALVISSGEPHHLISLLDLDLDSTPTANHNQPEASTSARPFNPTPSRSPPSILLRPVASSNLTGVSGKAKSKNDKGKAKIDGQVTAPNDFDGPAPTVKLSLPLHPVNWLPRYMGQDQGRSAPVTSGWEIDHISFSPSGMHLVAFSSCSDSSKNYDFSHPASLATSDPHSHHHPVSSTRMTVFARGPMVDDWDVVEDETLPAANTSAGSKSEHHHGVADHFHSVSEWATGRVIETEWVRKEHDREPKTTKDSKTNTNEKKEKLDRTKYIDQLGGVKGDGFFAILSDERLLYCHLPPRTSSLSARRTLLLTSLFESSSNPPSIFIPPPQSAHSYLGEDPKLDSIVANITSGMNINGTGPINGTGMTPPTGTSASPMGVNLNMSSLPTTGLTPPPIEATGSHLLAHRDDPTSRHEGNSNGNSRGYLAPHATVTCAGESKTGATHTSTFLIAYNSHPRPRPPLFPLSPQASLPSQNGVHLNSMASHPHANDTTTSLAPFFASSHAVASPSLQSRHNSLRGGDPGMSGSLAPTSGSGTLPVPGQQQTSGAGFLPDSMPMTMTTSSPENFLNYGNPLDMMGLNALDDAFGEMNGGEGGNDRRMSGMDESNDGRDNGGGDNNDNGNGSRGDNEIVGGDGNEGQTSQEHDGHDDSLSSRTKREDSREKWKRDPYNELEDLESVIRISEVVVTWEGMEISGIEVEPAAPIHLMDVHKLGDSLVDGQLVHLSWAQGHRLSLVALTTRWPTGGSPETLFQSWQLEKSSPAIASAFGSLECKRGDGLAVPEWMSFRKLLKSMGARAVTSPVFQQPSKKEVSLMVANFETENMVQEMIFVETTTGDLSSYRMPPRAAFCDGAISAGGNFLGLLPFSQGKTMERPLVTMSPQVMDATVDGNGSALHLSEKLAKAMVTGRDPVDIVIRISHLQSFDAVLGCLRETWRILQIQMPSSNNNNKNINRTPVLLKMLGCQQELFKPWDSVSSCLASDILNLCAVVKGLKACYVRTRTSTAKGSHNQPPRFKDDAIWSALAYSNWSIGFLGKVFTYFTQSPHTDRTSPEYRNQAPYPHLLGEFFVIHPFCYQLLVHIVWTNATFDHALNDNASATAGSNANSTRAAMYSLARQIYRDSLTSHGLPAPSELFGILAKFGETVDQAWKATAYGQKKTVGELHHESLITLRIPENVAKLVFSRVPISAKNFSGILNPLIAANANNGGRGLASNSKGQNDIIRRMPLKAVAGEGLPYTIRRCLRCGGPSLVGRNVKVGDVNETSETEESFTAFEAQWRDRCFCGGAFLRIPET